MYARTILVLTLILSLLALTQAQPLIVPVEMKAGNACAMMKCARGCCANMACCKFVERQRSPETPTAPAQQSHVQLGLLGLRVYSFLFAPAPRPPFVIRDEIGIAHTLPPLAASCIWLI